MELKKLVKKILALDSSSLLLITAAAFCNGWGAYEHGDKVKDMGCVFTGLADDPIAVHVNQAGVVQLNGTQGSFGFINATVTGTYESRVNSGMTGISKADKKDLETKSVSIPNPYIIHQSNDRVSVVFGEYIVRPVTRGTNFYTI